MTPLAGILPPRVRELVYAILAIVVPAVTLIVALLANGWQWADLPLIVVSLVSSAGFTLANNNTNVTPPA